MAGTLELVAAVSRSASLPGRKTLTAAPALAAELTTMARNTWAVMLATIDVAVDPAAPPGTWHLTHGGTQLAEGRVTTGD